MTKINALRKLIREEIVSALREELPRLLSENVSSESKSEYKNQIREKVRKSVTGGYPLTLNEANRPIPTFKGKDPLSMLLNETAMGMTPQDLGEEKEVETGSVDEMLQTARKSSNLEAVEIDTVPDFSGMMGKLKQKGLL